MANKNTPLIVHVLMLTVAGGIAASAEPIDFDRDIRPIFAEHCYACHGPDEKTRQADLRFDQPHVAIAELESGNHAIVPSSPDESEMIRRIFANDPDTQMPPQEFRKQLSVDAKTKLRSWIASGAKFDRHWSFQPIEKPSPPNVEHPGNNAIDQFIRARLKKAGLTHSTVANRPTLIRRLSLDLRGLPPSAQEIESFRNARYEQIVEHMLSSVHYGERMAQDWLDLARYGDTNGYHNDSNRSMWLYRDYVINSFNDNKSFDRFIVENMAGDLLPEANEQTRIASGFNRCVTFNEEGGADPDEFYVTYAVDRANTTGQVFLGLTVGCAQCHDHKYDPISQKEYYQLFAFFNNVDGEIGAGGEKGYHNQPLPPLLSVQTPDFKTALASLDARIASTTDEGQRKELEKEREKAIKNTPSTMVMVEAATRKPAYVLMRGDFQQPTDEVEPDVPAVFPRLPLDQPRNRLGLAYWLTDADHPLVARVAVNRIWKQLFGTGLVKTMGDFGIQGERPSHPGLLDWLAADFVEHGWDVKRLQRTIVNSATYQQSSRLVSQRYTAVDPENRLLSRAPRFRLTAEEIRDVALRVSGLLNNDVGGASVNPYQPKDYLQSIGKSWKQSIGEDQYRRGLYTFWRRTMLYPAFQIFDAPSREFCSVNRERTNTPLQALVTLNDPVFMEAARHFGKRILEEKGDDQSRLAFGFESATGRLPTNDEFSVLLSALKEQRDEFSSSTTAAKLLSRSDDTEAAVDLASWTAIANILLNLDETITRE